METPLVKMVSITKKFPGVVANRNVDFELKAGEIHALLGENGAGKSTLMSVLTGLYMPDEGEIHIKGRKVSFTSPRDAISAGIGMVHQHFRLVNSFSVAENVIMGSKSEGFLIDLGKVEKKLARFSEDYGLNVMPKVKVWQLSVGEQQRVEIVKMLYRGAEILVLDEPTAVLTPQESRELFATLRRMTERGKGVIVITHKLQEVMENADRITVLRNGQYVATFKVKDTNPRELAQAMVGRDITVGTDLPEIPKGETILQLNNLSAYGDRGQIAIKEINLEVRRGEVVGIAGVAGNGQKELAEVIAGLRAVAGGKLHILGQDFTGRSVRQIVDAGVSLIPEDRLGTGLVGSLDALSNSILKNYRLKDIGKGWFINWRSVRKYTNKLVEEYDVKLTSLEAPVKLLSGGNLQKLLLAREMSNDPEIIVAVYPARGLDIGAIETVRSILLKQREDGKAILLISEELEELFALSDRVAVIHEGEIMGIVDRDCLDLNEIGMMMAGERKEGDHGRIINR